MFRLILGPFIERFNRQVYDIHYVAHFLSPANILNRMNPSIESRVMKFFEQYTRSAEDAYTIRKEFLHFRSQFPPFESIRIWWKDFEIDKNNVDFWLSANEYTQLLGSFA